MFYFIDYYYMNILKKYEDIALSNKDILKKIDNMANIILYPDLHKYKTLDDILEPYGACVLLFEAKPKYGHWCCIFKVNDKLVEFFNPYGGYPDDSLGYISVNYKKRSHQMHTYLSYLMYMSPYFLSFNQYKFQKNSPNVRTCGRHVVVRLLHRNLSLQKYIRFLNKKCIEYNTDYDGVVTLLTINI